jgi:hypothetical protein
MERVLAKFNSKQTGHQTGLVLNKGRSGRKKRKIEVLGVDLDFGVNPKSRRKKSRKKM